MDITDVRVRKIAADGKLRGIASITFDEAFVDEAFVVHDIKIIEGANGLFIAMPSRKAAEGDYKDIAHPIKTEMREQIAKLILEKYNSEE
ncbi:MAG: septation regulator SpoVG [Clostridiales bacterium]|nr:septation regulator SpoVG [Clostridiales bacterium]